MEKVSNRSRAYYGMNLWHKLIISFLLILFLSTLFGLWSPNTDFDVSTVFSASATLFSILAGFFIASAMANFLRLKTLIATETGSLLSIYNLALAVKKDLGVRISDAIDRYVIASFDWELEEYVENTKKEFEDIVNVWSNSEVNIENKVQDYALQSLTNSMSSLPSLRNEITIVAKTTLNSLYWLLLILLAFITIFTLLLETDFTLVSMIPSIAVSTTIVFSLFLLEEIDKNKLNEADIAFFLYNQLLVSMNKLPYYLERDVKAKRIVPDTSNAYRLGRYLNYPKSIDKEIVEVKV
jgi:hypothetical protein